MPRPFASVDGLLTTVIIILCAGSAVGQNYPNKPVRIVTSPAGGGTDFVARLVAQGLSGPLEQQVVVDNRPVAVQGEIVAKSPPDGYTLLVSSGVLWVMPLMQNVPYDAIRDFSPISIVDRSPNVLVVHASLPVKSVKELIALAKARPGELNYASGPSGTPNHMAGELFKSMAGINLVRIGYKGGGPALNELLAGQVQLMFASAPSVAPHVKSGRLRSLAVTSSQPSTLAPDLPTMNASGVPGYVMVSVDALLAPAKTSAAIINRLNQELARLVMRTDIKEKFFNVGAEVVGSSPEELAAIMKSEIAVLGNLIKDTGIRPD